MANHVRMSPVVAGSGVARGRLFAAASTNLTNVKASKASLYGFTAGNTGAGAAFLKIYDKATAPVLASDTPVATYLLPAGANQHIMIEPPLALASGLSYAITGAAADNDTTAVTAAQVTGALYYV